MKFSHVPTWIRFQLYFVCRLQMFHPSDPIDPRQCKPALPLLEFQHLQSTVPQTFQETLSFPSILAEASQPLLPNSKFSFLCHRILYAQKHVSGLPVPSLSSQLLSCVLWGQDKHQELCIGRSSYIPIPLGDIVSLPFLSEDFLSNSFVHALFQQFLASWSWWLAHFLAQGT